MYSVVQKRNHKSKIINHKSMKRGLRNNNPLNIRHSADQWQGARAEQTDKSFVQFETMEHGYRAAWKVLESYWKYFHRVRQPFTVETIVGRWAPPGENDTRAYIRTVLMLTSLGGKENLPQPSRGVDTGRLVKLLAAMTTMECGMPYKEVDMEAIRKGYEMAFPGKRSYARTQPVDVDEAMEDLLVWDEYRDW